MTIKTVEVEKVSPFKRTLRQIEGLIKKEKEKKPKKVLMKRDFSMFRNYFSYLFMTPAYFTSKIVFNIFRSAAYLLGSVVAAVSTVITAFCSKETREFTKFSFSKTFECIGHAIIDTVTIPMAELVSVSGMLITLPGIKTKVKKAK